MSKKQYKKLSKKEYEMLWGGSGPYSEVKIVMETRILDDEVSREMLDVRGNINPTTFEIIKKNIDFFDNDEVVKQLINHARYSGNSHGYEISAGAIEYNKENADEAFEMIQKQLIYTRDAVIRMHKFVMENYNLESNNDVEFNVDEKLDVKVDFELQDIKFGVDSATLERAIEICGSKEISNVRCEDDRIMANVKGNVKDFYETYIFSDDFDRGDCNCYIGQKDILCKHMVALAIFSVMNGRELTKEDEQTFDTVFCSGNLGELDKESLSVVRKDITKSLRYIKPYNGPSSKWFEYQNSLLEGTYRLSSIISYLSVSKQTSDILINLLLRLDKKLCIGGVDDSDGIVGGFMYKIVDVFKEYIKLDVECKKSIKKLQNKETCFDWRDLLIAELEK